VHCLKLIEKKKVHAAGFREWKWDVVLILDWLECNGFAGEDISGSHRVSADVVECELREITSLVFDIWQRRAFIGGKL